jgi:hypothetical protein
MLNFTKNYMLKTKVIVYICIVFILFSSIGSTVFIEEVKESVSVFRI